MENFDFDDLQVGKFIYIDEYNVLKIKKIYDRLENNEESKCRIDAETEGLFDIKTPEVRYDPKKTKYGALIKKGETLAWRYDLSLPLKLLSKIPKQEVVSKVLPGDTVTFRDDSKYQVLGVVFSPNTDGCCWNIVLQNDKDIMFRSYTKDLHFTKYPKGACGYDIIDVQHPINITTNNVGFGDF